MERLPENKLHNPGSASTEENEASLSDAIAVLTEQMRETRQTDHARIVEMALELVRKQASGEITVEEYQKKMNTLSEATLAYGVSFEKTGVAAVGGIAKRLDNLLPNTENKQPAIEVDKDK